MKTVLAHKLASALSLAAIITLLSSATPVSAIIVTTTNGSGADAQLTGWGGPNADPANATDVAVGTATSMSARTTTNRNEIICLRFDLTGYTRTDYFDYTLQLINFRTNSAATLAFYGVTDNAVAEDNNGTVRGYTDDTWLESPLEFSTMPGMHWTNSSTANQAPNAGTTLLGSVTLGTVNEGTTTSFTSAALTTFIRNHADSLVTIIIKRTDSGSGLAQYAAKEASLLNAGGGSGIPGDYAPRLTFGNPITSVIWNGSVSTDWNNPTNWTLPVVPTNGVSATIPGVSNVVYSTPAPSFGNLINQGLLTINTNGFNNTGIVINRTSGGAGLIINTGGVVSVTGTFGICSNNFASVSPGSSLTVSGSLNIGSNPTGGSSSPTTGAFGRMTNNGGTISAAATTFNSGNATVTGNPLFVINGGTNSLGDVDIGRPANSSQNALGTDGLIINGGLVNMTSLRLGNNNFATMLVSPGSVVTNTGGGLIRNTTANRPSRLLQTGGLFVTLGTNTMTVSSATGNGATFSVTGGTNMMDGLQFGDGSVNPGTANFTNSATVFIGAGGIANSGSAVVNARLNPGGIFGATADWTGSSPMVLGTSNFTFQTASPDGTAYDINLAGVLSGAGPLVKTGGGVLTLEAANTYSAATLINSGTLALGVSGSLESSEISVSSNTVFDVSAVAGYTLPALKTLSGFGVVTGDVSVASTGIINPGASGVRGMLSFSNSIVLTNGSVTHFDLSTNPNGPTNDLIVIQNDLTVSGTNILEISGGGVAGSVHPLFRYYGTFTGDLTNNFELLGATGALTNITSTTPKSIALRIATTVRGPTNIVWVGNAVTNDWDVLNATNWLNGGSLSFFVSGDQVRFNASGAAHPNVNIAESVQPGSVLVDAATDYTFSGVGIISGAATLTKTNSGKLIVQTNHLFTGGVNLNGGTVSVAALADVGEASPLGASGTIAFSGGTLEYTGPNTTWTRDLSLVGAGTLSVTGATEVLTLSGQVGGAGSLVKSGDGTVILNNGNGYAGGSLLNAGTLQLNVAAGAGTGTINLNGGTLVLGAVKPANTVNAQSASIIRGGNAGGATGVSGITGDAPLTLEVTTGVFDLIGSMVTYSNTVTFSNVGGATIRFNGTTGSSLATFDLGAETMELTIRNSLQNVNIGGLKGGVNTILSGRAPSDNNGPTTHHIGANGQSTTFDGIIRNGLGGGSSTTTIVKTGPGTLTLSGNNTYSGTTTISNGVLALTGSGAIDSTSVIDIQAGTALDVSGRFDGTLTLAASKTLKGNGTLRGSLTANGTVSPGESIGTLTVTNNITLAGTLHLELDRDNAQKSDRLTNTSGTLTYGGILQVQNIGPALQVGDSFQLFPSAAVGFGSIVISPTDASGAVYSWTNKVEIDGSIQVIGITERIYAATTGNQLISFSATAPGTILSANAITGLQSGEAIVGIDFQANTLYAVGDSSRLYTINRVTGAATAVGTFTPVLSGLHFGMEVEPAGVRVVSELDQNLLLDFTTGAATVGTVINGSPDPTISGLARHPVTGQYYVADYVANTIGTFNAATGVAVATNLSGIDFSRNNGFDISAGTNHTAYLASPAASSDPTANLYTINLAPGPTFGAVTLVGLIGPAEGYLIRGLAIGPDFSPAAPGVNPNPTNITFSASSSTLNLSWPASHIGWILQFQTNSRAIGLKTNWVDVAGSASVTATNFPINKADPTVFYRLRKP